MKTKTPNVCDKLDVYNKFGIKNLDLKYYKKSKQKLGFLPVLDMEMSKRGDLWVIGGKLIYGTHRIYKYTNGSWLHVPGYGSKIAATSTGPWNV